MAELVLSNLQIIFEEHSVDGYANTYHNVRENGFCVHLSAASTLKLGCTSGRVAYFSNIRNADGIVVYFMDNMNTDGIDDDAYNTSKSFDESEAYDAAMYIYETLIAEKCEEETDVER